MEKFYKQKNNNYKRENLDFQIIEWWANDEECDNVTENSENERDEQDDSSSLLNSAYVIRCFGVTENGDSITCKINNFKPYYYIKVSNDFNRIRLHQFLSWVESSYFLKDYSKRKWDKEEGDWDVTYFGLEKRLCCIEEKKDLFGFRNGKTYKFVKLVFNSYKAMMKSRWMFKKPVTINNITKKPTKFKLYESNIEPFMRFCHIKDIRMAGWLQLPKGKWQRTQETASTQLEVEIDWNDVVSLKDKQDMANFLQASWDIEVYSHDGSFPDPKVVKNEIFQIATTYKYYNDNSICVKHLLTLKTCDSINDPTVVVECCKDERDLIRRWVKTISQMDPDIFYTYNGDGFDCMYLKERAILHKLAGTDGKSGYLFNNLSRLTSIPAEIKKEAFSSSAYGDSEFNRIYIPGRLNYDLLIHFKRGMKKYSSYKLDHIANEILKKGKHDVSAKQIFEYYKIGTPDKIKTIAEYCIMDTELLQQLVDKQLILITIIQLANVTFVPIGFLTTRGQTIKVFSQILRKARQMNFLIPHTNFNEDSYSLEIKTDRPHGFDEENCGEYIEIDCGKSQTSTGRALKINGKIIEILDDVTIVVICDTEITNEFFNINFKYRSSTYKITRMYSRDDLIDDSFTGATVLNAKPGFFQDNVGVLDFASLYPTIMISRNLCFSTFLLDKKYKNIPGVKYETIEWDDQVEYKLSHTCEGIGKSGKSKGMVCGKQAFFDVPCNLNDNCVICKSKEERCEKHYYCRIHDPLKKTRLEGEKFQKRDVSYSYTIIQPHKDIDGNIQNKGVLPALLEDLYAERKKVKRLMAKAADDGNKLLEDIYNSVQMAIKISLNSCYGFLGRRQGNLVLKELGSIVTAVGRMLIEQSRDYVEGEFLELVKEQNLLKHKLKYDKEKINSLSDKEKTKILKRFECK